MYSPLHFIQNDARITLCEIHAAARSDVVVVAAGQGAPV